MLNSAPSALSATVLTVNDTPSRQTEPLGAMNGAMSPGTWMAMRVESPTGETLVMRPTASTWPVTIWPPSSSPTFKARSRLSRRPATHWPLAVRLVVSPDTSTLNSPAALATTVRQTPEQATEAPSASPAVS